MHRTLRNLASLAVLAAACGLARANDTTFSYQGSLQASGAAADGAYDMTFRLFPVAAGGTQLASQTIMGVPVQSGLFTVELDFGAADFTNIDRWLEIEVEGVTLSPRQPITRAPYAVQTRGMYSDENRDIGIGATDLDFDVHLYRGFLLGANPPTTMGLEWNRIDIGGGGVNRWLYTRVGGSLAQPAGHDGAHVVRDNTSKLHFSTASTSTAGIVNPQVTLLDSGLLGIGELEALAHLHVERTSIALPGAAVLNDDIIAEDSDAVLGLYSDEGGSRGSAIVLGEIAGGALTDKWGIGRNTSTGGGALYIKYGPSADYSSNPTFFALETDGDAYFLAGRLGVGTSNPQTTLDVNGTARCDVLEIVGADVAERFPTTDADDAEPGTVLEIDPDNPGQLRVARGSYSRLVAGVVSGANGLPAGTILGNLPGAESSPAVALTGRVWVRCDAGQRAIKPGDMLTTSDTPGHAMRADDFERSQGAVIGKAMTGLDLGQTGMVLVLVNLQ